MRLGTAIREHPERFAGFEFGKGFTASLVDADEEFVTAAVRGGRTKVRWTAVDAARLGTLVERAAVPPAEVLPLASLLRASGAQAAAEKVLVRAVEAGGDRAGAHARVARWRGEAVPQGGYVVYEGGFVAPAERDRLVLQARIAAACAKVLSPAAKERKAACDELLALGEPARPAFAKALRARREAAAKDVAALKVFHSAKTRARLVEELRRRREAALALISDETRYPYPYPEGQEHPGQREVDRLVDLVREVWERPFDLIAAWDPAAADALAPVREVDELLEKVEEGYQPDLDAVKALIAKAIDVPALVADPLDAETLAYNERVATTANVEEKENVRIVNAYRIMMGRPAVKLDERLVRAARGHSREMHDRGYFAHESPTPGLESPGKRAQREGYGGGVGENIAKGPPDAKGAFEGWYQSSGHHRNMLGARWTEMGTGKYGALWTQLFGGSGSRSRIARPVAVVAIFSL